MTLSVKEQFIEKFSELQQINLLYATLLLGVNIAEDSLKEDERFKEINDLISLAKNSLDITIQEFKLLRLQIPEDQKEEVMKELFEETRNIISFLSEGLVNDDDEEDI